MTMGQRLPLMLLTLFTSLIQLVSAEPECRHGYFESHAGYKLQGHVIRRMSTDGIWACVLECRRCLMCFSLNVNTGKDARIQCELNKSSKKASPKDYVRVSSSGQEYLDLIPDKPMDQWMTQALACSSNREALPNGWYRYHSFVYKYFNEKLVNQLARQQCLNLNIGADLVSLENQMEKEFLKSLFYVESTTANVSTSADDKRVWIGLYDNKTTGERTFEWSDGRTYKYTNWADGEPNDLYSKEHCVISFADDHWNDAPCDQTYGFVCKAPDFR